LLNNIQGNKNMMTKLYVNAVTLLNEFKRDERGVTAIEYGLIGVAMAVLLGAAYATNGNLLTNLKAAFDGIATNIAKVSS
jgi:pilus assembly protein Flp/PilA